jgi:hypothetical protein
MKSPFSAENLIDSGPDARRGDICTVLAAATSRAFDLLEPSLGGYGIRPAR